MADDVVSEEAKPRMFKIGSDEYEIPEVFGFDFDEAQILYDYSKLTIEDFVADGDDGQMTADGLLSLLEKMKNPAFLRALRHVAYRRKNLGASEAKIKVSISGDNFAEAYVEWITSLDQESDDGPPLLESTKELEEPSPSSTVDETRSSGSDASEPTSIGQDIHLATIGATK
jgi:hypothetical protein